MNTQVRRVVSSKYGSCSKKCTVVYVHAFWHEIIYRRSRSMDGFDGEGGFFWIAFCRLAAEKKIKDFFFCGKYRVDSFLFLFFFFFGMFFSLSLFASFFYCLATRCLLAKITLFKFYRCYRQRSLSLFFFFLATPHTLDDGDIVGTAQQGYY